MARRNSILKELVEQLFELTGYIWQAGIIATSFLLFLSYKSYVWADSIIANGEAHPIIAALEKLP